MLFLIHPGHGSARRGVGPPFQPHPPPGVRELLATSAAAIRPQSHANPCGTPRKRALARELRPPPAPESSLQQIPADSSPLSPVFAKRRLSSQNLWARHVARLSLVLSAFVAKCCTLIRRGSASNVFTGIIEHLGTIESLDVQRDGGRVSIHAPSLGPSLAVANSIAVNGC